MSTKIAGYTLLWFGVMALLKNLGVIRFIDWSLIWPVILIVAGLSIKHMKHSPICCVGGKCGLCSTSNHKCEGATCNVCNK